jgi:hypothetical protein
VTSSPLRNDGAAGVAVLADPRGRVVREVARYAVGVCVMVPLGQAASRTTTVARIPSWMGVGNRDSVGREGTRLTSVCSTA